VFALVAFADALLAMPLIQVTYQRRELVAG
jgi:hypothetical protein